MNQAFTRATTPLQLAHACGMILRMIVRMPLELVSGAQEESRVGHPSTLGTSMISSWRDFVGSCWEMIMVGNAVGTRLFLRICIISATLNASWVGLLTSVYPCGSMSESYLALTDEC